MSGDLTTRRKYLYRQRCGKPLVEQKLDLKFVVVQLCTLLQYNNCYVASAFRFARTLSTFTIITWAHLFALQDHCHRMFHMYEIAQEYTAAGLCVDAFESSQAFFLKASALPLKINFPSLCLRLTRCFEAGL